MITECRKFFAKKIATCRFRSALGSLPDPGGELFDLIEDLAAFGHLVADLALGVHHGGVVAAEGLPDLGQ